jgi:DNA-binding response OmpR family regulator
MSRRPPLILIADDDRDIVDALSIHCRSIGLAVEFAYDGMTALCKIDELQPNLVVLDVNMPGRTGLDIREVMTSNQFLKSIPVIILTGRGDMDTMRRSHELSTYFVPKCADCWSRVEPLIKELLPEATKHSNRLQSSARDSGQTGPTQTGWRTHPSGTFPKCCIDDLFVMLSTQRSPQSCNPKPDVRKEKADRRPWVLCVDDDRELSHGLKMRLEQHGVRCVRAFAGMQGYLKAFEYSPAAVVLDYELPDGNGDYILRRLKESPATEDIPVIVITGHKNKSLERKMYNLGAEKFFYKPLKWAELWAELQLHLERHAVAKTSLPEGIPCQLDQQ